MSELDLATQISRLAHLAKDSNLHWISTPDGTYETNNGSDWCRDCGYHMMRHLRRKDRKRAGDYILDGGWRTESDTHSFCAHCGCWLRISLTDYGVEEELAHYRQNGVTQNPIADEAYSLDILYSAVSGTKDEHEVEALARDLVARPEAQAILHPECSTCNGTGKEGRHSICRDCDETPSPQANLRVKKLVWELHGEGFRCRGPLIYDVYPDGDGGWWACLSMAGYLPYRGRASTAEEARKAAQRDFELRITDGIETPTPVSKPEGTE